MTTLLVAVGSFFGFIIAYHTYGRFLAKKLFEIDCPRYTDIEFKLAVQAKEWNKVNEMIKNKEGKQKKNLI